MVLPTLCHSLLCSPQEQAFDVLQSAGNTQACVVELPFDLQHKWRVVHDARHIGGVFLARRRDVHTQL